MYITKIIYKKDEATIRFNEDGEEYAFKINRKKDLQNEEVVNAWTKFISLNYPVKNEDDELESLLFYAWWIEGENEIFLEQKTIKQLINN